MKHLHVLLTDDQYKAINSFARKNHVSQALATRYIVQWWRKDGPKENPLSKKSKKHV